MPPTLKSAQKFKDNAVNQNSTTSHFALELSALT